MKTLEIENEKIVQIEFTLNRLFARTDNGKVYVWVLKQEAKNDFIRRYGYYLL